MAIWNNYTVNGVRLELPLFNVDIIWDDDLFHVVIRGIVVSTHSPDDKDLEQVKRLAEQKVLEMIELTKRELESIREELFALKEPQNFGEAFAQALNRGVMESQVRKTQAMTSSDEGRAADHGY